MRYEWVAAVGRPVAVRSGAWRLLAVRGTGFDGFWRYGGVNLTVCDGFWRYGDLYKTYSFYSKCEFDGFGRFLAVLGGTG